MDPTAGGTAPHGATVGAPAQAHACRGVPSIPPAPPGDSPPQICWVPHCPPHVLTAHVGDVCPGRTGLLGEDVGLAGQMSHPVPRLPSCPLWVVCAGTEAGPCRGPRWWPWGRQLRTPAGKAASSLLLFPPLTKTPSGEGPSCPQVRRTRPRATPGRSRRLTPTRRSPLYLSLNHKVGRRCPGDGFTP